MPNYLQIPVIDDMVQNYAYDFGRDLRPGDVFMMNKGPLINNRSFIKKGGSTVTLGHVRAQQSNTLDTSAFYSDYLFLFMVDEYHAIAPFCTGTYAGAGGSTGLRPQLGDSGSTDFNQYNCTAPIVELESTVADLTGTLDGVTELVDGLFFIGKVLAHVNNNDSRWRTIDINGLGAHHLRRYDYATQSYNNVRLASESVSNDTYYPFLFYKDAWYCLSESTVSSNIIEK